MLWFTVGVVWLLLLSVFLVCWKRAMDVLHPHDEQDLQEQWETLNEQGKKLH